MNITNHLSIGLIFLTLTACVNATVSSAQAVYDRRSIQGSLNDQYIAATAERKIYIYDDRFKDTHVNVASFHRVVLLTGQVSSAAQKQEIEKMVRTVEGIQELHNVITISPIVSAMTAINDSWITTKIKAKLIAMNDIDPAEIKVITENKNVYLLGILPHEEAEIAVDLARQTEGVEKVVKIFSYITISKV